METTNRQPSTTKGILHSLALTLVLNHFLDDYFFLLGSILLQGLLCLLERSWTPFLGLLLMVFLWVVPKNQLIPFLPYPSSSYRLVIQDEEADLPISVGFWESSYQGRFTDTLPSLSHESTSHPVQGLGAGSAQPLAPLRQTLYGPKGEIVFDIQCEPTGFFSKLRAQIRGSMENLGVSQDLAAALVMGDHALLTKSRIESFRNNGVSHLLVLSGMHLSFYLVIIGCFSRGKVLVIFSLGFLIFYVSLIGPSPSLIRCLLYFLLSRVSDLIPKKLSSLELLSLSLVCQVICFPAHTHLMGFWLSYSATAGILLSPRLKIPKGLFGFLFRILQLLTTSFAAIGASAPFLLTMGWDFPLQGIILGAILGPLVFLLLVIGNLLCLVPAELTGVLIFIFSFLDQTIMEILRSFPKLSLPGESALVLPGGFLMGKIWFRIRVRELKFPRRCDILSPVNYDSPSEIKSFLEKKGLGARKRWGQNFLINSSARKRIQSFLGLEVGEDVWEVGPGLGAMTHGLLCAGHAVKAFEIDPAYVQILGESLSETGLLTVVEGDVVKTWKSHVLPSGLPKVLGNLPYNAASAIIASFIESGVGLSRMVVTVQKEMGDRILAKPRTKDYSSFSVLCQLAFQGKSKGDLGAGSFYPPPRVHSSILVLDPLDLQLDIDLKRTSRMVRGLFASRRKTIKNNLGTAASALNVPKENFSQWLSDQGVDLSLRPEALEVDLYRELGKNLKDLV